MIRIEISAAYEALAAGATRGLLEAQRSPTGGFYVWLDQVDLKTSSCPSVGLGGFAMNTEDRSARTIEPIKKLSFQLIGIAREEGDRLIRENQFDQRDATATEFCALARAAAYYGVFIGLRDDQIVEGLRAALGDARSQLDTPEAR